MGSPCDWQVTNQKVAQRGKHILETGQWSDCKFIVGQEPHQQILEGHKLFLAMASPVFEAMFYGGMAEKNDPIPIRDVQPEAFKALLEYIYTDNIDLGSFELACELCYCAKKYMLPFLVEECTKFLWSDLSPKKACRAYEFAKLFEEPVLMEKCLQIICTKTNSVLSKPSFEEIEIGTLVTVFEQEELEINSEIELFSAAERWARSECIRKGLDPEDSKSLRSVIGNALTKIRFLTLSPQEFAEGPAGSSLLNQDEAFAILMNISSSERKWPMPEGFSTNVQSRVKPLKQHPTMGDLSAIGVVASTSGASAAGGLNNMLSDGQAPNSSSKLNSRSLLFPKNSSQDNSQWPAPQHVLESFSNLTNSLLANNSSNVMGSGAAVEGGAVREGLKYYCLRSIVQQTDCLNTSVLDCSVAFNVDRNICVIGVQVPTQVRIVQNQSIAPFDPFTSAVPGSYTELLYAHLLDSDGSRLTYTHYTSRVNVDSLVEITFNRPVYIQRNKVYRVGVVFNKVGWYPMGACTQRMACDSVFFSFGVGNSSDSVRDGLIRSIIFTY
ncbi:uncharacterized protein LOC124176140 isoform X1 [Neodiprion fabricii]|uniref:uncharacterized protein LOC124176140 isoform X1 n=1 Tax=Neodiprion fabricii TaxID=2872261 RepID=UPI001ED924E8|nr:uncharacterized protein LOC124176140 isoform X1 [Neodiprion fabricii]XP_046412979.1 uncharacterized protein LOC124176140 isoform X1 [Neodiprion fabricii]